MTMCVWCIPKIRLKSTFDIQSKSAKIGTKKGVFIKQDKSKTVRGQKGDIYKTKARQLEDKRVTFIRQKRDS